MKNYIKRTALMIGICLSACTTTENYEPGNDISVTKMNRQLDFSGDNSFIQPIDMNGDGTVDFALRGIRRQTPEQVSQSFVLLVSNLEDNQVLSRESTPLEICGNTLVYNPARIVHEGHGVGDDASEWIVDPVLYLHAASPSDCNVYAKHYEDGVVNTLGVRFMHSGYTFYGWIKFKTEDLTHEGCPELSEIWTLIECGFNKIPDQAVVIPIM